MLGRVSHKMIGSAGMIGATALAAVCKRIENAARGQSSRLLPGLGMEYATALQRVLVELDRV